MSSSGLHPLRSHPVNPKLLQPLYPPYLHPSQLSSRSPAPILTPSSPIGLPKSPRPEHRFTPASPRSPDSFMSGFTSSPSSERGLGFYSSTSPSERNMSPISPSQWSSYTKDSERHLLPRINTIPPEPEAIPPTPMRRMPDHTRHISTRSAGDEGNKSDTSCSSSSSSSSIARLTRKLRVEVRQCFSPSPKNYSPDSPSGGFSSRCTKIEPVHWTEL